MSSRLQLTPEVLVPRLGDYLVEKGLITAEQLKQALGYQESLKKSGEIQPLLGQVLITLEFVDRQELDRAITEQILQLRKALEKTNQQLENRVKERTAELERAYQKLAEMARLKANFVSNISHELRTPLTHIKGYLELFKSRSLGPVNEEQVHSLEIMILASDRLERLIEDLLLFSTMEKERISLEIKPFQIHSICEAVAGRCEPRATEKGVAFHINCEPDLPEIEADESKITWVIMQFLDNAIKFTPNGGQIVLAAKKQGELVSVSVTDNGIGISQENFEEIFEPFHQLDGSTTRKYGGTGMGLSLAKKIIESHGSSIKISSRSGQGSRFEFFLSPHRPPRHRL